MARYWVKFAKADVGLTPSFVFFKKVSDSSPVGSPSITEFQDGIYFFDFTPTFEIIHQIDGGAGVANPANRYVSDIISPSDGYLDEPISQVKTDVWNEPYSGHLTAGTFGQAITDTNNYAQRLTRVSEGRWKVHTTGPDANKLVLYDADGTTVLQKWSLTDSTGTPSTGPVFERVPTETIP